MRVNLSGNEAYGWIFVVNNVIAHKSYYTVRKSWVDRNENVREPPAKGSEHERETMSIYIEL